MFQDVSHHFESFVKPVTLKALSSQPRIMEYCEAKTKADVETDILLCKINLLWRRYTTFFFFTMLTFLRWIKRMKSHDTLWYITKSLQVTAKSVKRFASSRKWVNQKRYHLRKHRANLDGSFLWQSIYYTMLMKNRWRSV